MDIATIYQIVSLKSQSSPREYIDTSGKQLKKPPVKQKRRQTFVEQIEKLSKEIPGPGKY